MSNWPSLLCVSGGSSVLLSRAVRQLVVLLVLAPASHVYILLQGRLGSVVYVFVLEEGKLREPIFASSV